MSPEAASRLEEIARLTMSGRTVAKIEWPGGNVAFATIEEYVLIPNEALESAKVRLVTFGATEER